MTFDLFPDLLPDLTPAEITPPITYLPQFLSLRQQAMLLNETADYPLEKIQIEVFGKRHFIPRTQVWFGDEGCKYKYSNTFVSPKPWPPILTKLRQTLFNKCQLSFNTVLVNRYENGTESMGWHSDDEPEIVANSAIASVTLGACRDFVLKHKATSKQVSLALASGDLLIMHAGMQQTWQHAVPKRLRVTEPRINFTFRQVTPHYYR